MLALIHESKGVTTEVLSNLKVNTIELREAVEAIIGREDRKLIDEIGFTPRAEKAIELAKQEARRMHHHYVGIEHLLLGLMREGQAIAAGVLESRGVNVEKVLTETKKVLQQQLHP